MWILLPSLLLSWKCSQESSNIKKTNSQGINDHEIGWVLRHAEVKRMSCTVCRLHFAKWSSLKSRCFLQCASNYGHLGANLACFHLLFSSWWKGLNWNWDFILESKSCLSFELKKGGWLLPHLCQFWITVMYWTSVPYFWADMLRTPFVIEPWYLKRFLKVLKSVQMTCSVWTCQMVFLDWHIVI